MIIPYEYEVHPQITAKRILYNKFIDRGDYYSIYKTLYGTYVSLSLFINKEDNGLVVNVHDNNGYTYSPFYNPDNRHNNLVYKEVVKNYNRFMDDLVTKKILIKKDENKNMNKSEIKIKRLNDKAKLPTHGSEKSAGYDLHACIDTETVTIKPHETVKIGTGLSIELPDGSFGAIFARSGLATKSGLRPANCVGVCDSDYRGEYIVAIHNDTDTAKTIANGERIAQLVVMPYVPVNFVEVDDLSETERGSGGFGSTGK